jgi:hypothetical protein
MVEPLGSSICGRSSEDRCAVSSDFSHRVMTQVVQYVAFAVTIIVVITTVLMMKIDNDCPK